MASAYDHALQLIVGTSPGGTEWTSANESGVIRFWDPKGTEFAEKRVLTGESIRAVCYGPQSGTLITGSDDGRVCIWDTKAKKKRHGPLKVGVPIRSLIPLSETTAALGADGVLYFFDQGANLTAEMVADQDGLVISTPEGWYSGEGDNYKQTLLFRGGSDFPLSAEESLDDYSRSRSLSATTGKKSLFLRARDTMASVYQHGLDFYSRLHSAARAALVTGVGYLAVLSLVMTLWLVNPAAFAALHMTPGNPEPKLSWAWVTNTLFFAKWLGQRERSTDAWLSRHKSDFFDVFFTNPGVALRLERFVELGNSADVDGWVASVAERRGRHVVITGSGGGAGKSTLAYEMVAEAIRVRESPPLIPLLFDYDWREESLEPAMQKKLSVGKEVPPLDLVRRWWATGRILLILDGLSERRVQGAEATLISLVHLPGNHFVLVTTRSALRDDRFENVRTKDLREGETSWTRFIEKYLGTDHSRLDEVSEQLKEWGKGQPIRPLFADLAIRAAAGRRDLPPTLAAVISTFLRDTRPRGPNAVREEDFIRAACIVAFAGVEKNTAPSEVTEQLCLGYLGNAAAEVPFQSEAMGGDEGSEREPRQVLDQLVGCGLLERFVVYSVGYVRFTQDVIAEYCAAFYLLSDGHTRALSGFRRRASFPNSGVAEAIEDIRPSR